MGLIRAFLYLFMPFLLLGIAVNLAFPLGIGFLGIALMALAGNAIAAALIAWFSDKMGSMASVIYTGYRQRSAKDQHGGNLTRARHLKS
jgi:hypothetical protein